MFRLKAFDWSFVIVPLILTVISLATLYTITYVSVGNKLTISQGLYALVGFGLLIIFSLFDYRHFKSFSIILFILGIAVLVPLLPAISHKVSWVICEFNSCRWINLGFFRFQTSELFKLIIIITISAFLADRYGKLAWWHLFFGFGILIAPIFLIMEQPDLGTAIVILATCLVMFWHGKFPLWIWVVILGLAFVTAPIAWNRLKPYQQKRIEVFFYPEKDPNKTGYNVRQAQIAVGSGGSFGRGFGKGSQSQLNFLPVAHTDFIFAGYAEATGFAGSLFLIGVFAFLVWRTIHVAEIAKDTFGRFLAIGIAVMFAVQVIINIGMNIRLMPVTGVPLPLVSYGGTSFFINMIALGIIQSIVVRHKKFSFGD
jgi:rod shape determining protein RodA